MMAQTLTKADWAIRGNKLHSLASSIGTTQSLMCSASEQSKSVQLCRTAFVHKNGFILKVISFKEKNIKMNWLNFSYCCQWPVLKNHA